MLGSQPPAATWLAKATAAAHSLPLPGRLHVASIREEYAGPVAMARRPEGVGVRSEERWNVSLDPAVGDMGACLVVHPRSAGHRHAPVETTVAVAGGPECSRLATTSS